MVLNMQSSNFSDEENSDDSINTFPENIEDEIDINIHFHCEHCIKLKKCQESPKPGWSCEIISCQYGCGHRLHACKISEHELMCSHLKVPCLNAGNGCPFIITRRFIAKHLIVCPASVVICTAEWNRWAVGAKERERISSAMGISTLYDKSDLDLCFALNDQKMVNDMHSFPQYVRELMCNDINKRFPSLPITVRGSYHEEHKVKSRKETGRSTSITVDAEEGLTTEFIKGDTQTSSDSSLLLPTSNSFETNRDSLKFKNSQLNTDDFSARCCSHGILKYMCQFCKNDPDDPVFKFGTVWRETIEPSSPASIVWMRENRIDKVRKRGPFDKYWYKKVDDLEDEEEDDVKLNNEIAKICPEMRFRTPPPAHLTPKGLTLEVGLKHFSRHQVKPKAMFTFQCMKEVRRDEFESHYQNVHSEIQEGLDGWLMERCPLHIIGCPFSTMRMFPGNKPDVSKVIYCHSQRGFGITPTQPEISGKEPDHCRSTSMDKFIVKSKTPTVYDESTVQFLASSKHITTLPFEVLQCVVRYLDGFSLNNVSRTCRLFRQVCFSQLNEKGLVIQEWIRQVDGDCIRWKLGNNRWFFSNCFHHVRHWNFKNEGAVANHLSVCPFNDRTSSEKKFSYMLNIKEEIQKLYKKFSKL